MLPSSSHSTNESLLPFSEALDIEYIREWVRKLGVEFDWERIIREADV